MKEEKILIFYCRKCRKWMKKSDTLDMFTSHRKGIGGFYPPRTIQVCSKCKGPIQEKQMTPSELLEVLL